MNNQKLISSKKVLKSFLLYTDDSIIKYKDLLSSWKKILPKFYAHQDQIIKKSHNVIRRFKNEYLSRFDIFRIAGFFPNENAYSDTLAAIINPQGQHGLEKKPLRSIIQYIAENRNKEVSMLLDSIDKTPIEEIIIERERNEFNTIPDITILSPNFVIYIENKVRGGSETLHVDGVQTERQWKRLQYHGKRTGINKKCIMGIFLSPEGKHAVSNKFIPLSTYELSLAILQSLGQDKNSGNYLIRAFFEFYSFQ